MSKIAVSGGAGYVGRFIVDRLLTEGHDVVVLGRSAPTGLFASPTKFRQCRLGEKPHPDLFQGCDAFVHAAFHHVAGKYRGGEGDEPEMFRRLNYNGSIALFNAAKNAGVRRTIFLSSRAIYGKQEPGLTLFEDTRPNPDSLYGKTKLDTEHALAALKAEGFLPIIARATGIYGVSEGARHHKWKSLFRAFTWGELIAPHIGTEVHGADLAAAIHLLLTIDATTIMDVSRNEPAIVFNVSDIMLDRRELLRAYMAITAECSSSNLPQSTDSSGFNQMDCSRLKALGWRPRGKLDLSWTANQ